MSEFSGRDDFDLRRVVTEVDFKMGRRADQSASGCADPDEDSLGVRSLLGQFTAGGPATADPADEEPNSVRDGAATAHDVNGAEIRRRDAPPPVPARPADCEPAPGESTPQPPVLTGTAPTDVAPPESLDWRDAAEPSTGTESSGHGLAARRSPPREQTAADRSASVDDARPSVASARPSLARRPRVVVPAVAAAVLVAVVLGVSSGGSGAVRDPRTATASQTNAFDLTAVLGQALRGVSSELGSLARAVPSTRHKPLSTDHVGSGHARRRTQVTRSAPRASRSTAAAQRSATASPTPENQNYTRPSTASPSTTSAQQHAATSNSGSSAGPTNQGPLGGIGSCVQGCS